MMDDKHHQIGPESAAPRNTPQHDRSPRMSAPDQLDHSEPAPTNEDRLRSSLAWHFRCHAEEPGKSYASLGIANAELIVARMVADAKAEVLREAARYFEYEAAPAWGGDATWISTGAHVADLVAEHLRDRAASLDTEADR